MTPKPSLFAEVVAITFVVFAAAVAFVMTPLVALLVGMAIGYILEFMTGDYLVLTFNKLGLSSIQSGDLPKVFGLLSVIAIFFKVKIKGRADHVDKE